MHESGGVRSIRWTRGVGAARLAGSATAWAGRAAGAHRGARRAVRRRADARRQVPVPPRAAVHSRQRGRGRGDRCGRRRHAVPRRRQGDEPPQPRRLRGTGQRQGRAMRSCAGGDELRGGRCVPRRVFDRLSCAAATRTDEGGRVGAGAWRRRRHRHRSDPGGEAVRCQGDRHRQHRARSALPAWRKAPIMRSTTGVAFSTG